MNIYAAVLTARSMRLAEASATLPTAFFITGNKRFCSANAVCIDGNLSLLHHVRIVVSYGIVAGFLQQIMKYFERVVAPERDIGTRENARQRARRARTQLAHSDVVTGYKFSVA